MERRTEIFRRIIIASKARRQGKRERLLLLLARSGSALTEDDLVRIDDCSEVSMDRWIADVERKAAERDVLERGIREGKRDTLLRIVERAGIALADDDRARIRACDDIATLDRWIDNSLVEEPDSG
jgi:hypothetical protein